MGHSFELPVLTALQADDQPVLWGVNHDRDGLPSPFDEEDPFGDANPLRHRRVDRDDRPRTLRLERLGTVGRVVQTDLVEDLAVQVAKRHHEAGVGGAVAGEVIRQVGAALDAEHP